MNHPCHWVRNLRCRKVEVRRYGFHRSPLGATHRQVGEYIQFDHALWSDLKRVYSSNGIMITYVCLRLSADSMLFAKHTI
jgi:hypothetical protein